MLFIARTEAALLARILEQVGTQPVLTVGEQAGFCEAGGAVNILVERSAPRLEANPDALLAGRAHHGREGPAARHPGEREGRHVTSGGVPRPSRPPQGPGGAVHRQRRHATRHLCCLRDEPVVRSPRHAGAATGRDGRDRRGPVRGSRRVLQQPQATAILASLRAERQVRLAAAYAGDGALFATYVREGEEPDLVPGHPGPDRALLGGGELIVVRPLVSDGERIGTLLLRADMADVRRRLLRDLGTAGLIVLCNGAGGPRARAVWAA